MASGGIRAWVFQQVEKVRIGYIIDGVQMYTDYPATHWLSTTGANLPDAVPALFSLQQRRLSLLNPDASFTLYSIAGTVVAEGCAPTADLSHLPTGAYILRISSDNTSETHKIML